MSTEVMKEIGEYWNARSSSYGEAIRSQLAGETGVYYREKLLKYAPKSDTMECLDLGCGPGFFSIILAKAGHHVTAFDYSEGMLLQASQNFELMGVQVNTVQGDAACLPFKDNSFDYIVSRNVVWNLQDPYAAYKEWLRVLKPGGHLFVSDANHYLYLSDETYRKANEIRWSKYVDHHPNANFSGVDPKKIETIAKDHLPLSDKLRPEWDITAFRSLGIGSISIETDPKYIVDERTGEKLTLIGDFIICAGKDTKSLMPREYHS